MADLNKSIVLYDYNSADYFYDTRAKRLAGQKSEDRVLTVMRRNLR